MASMYSIHLHISPCQCTCVCIDMQGMAIINVLSKWMSWLYCWRSLLGVHRKSRTYHNISCPGDGSNPCNCSWGCNRLEIHKLNILRLIHTAWNILWIYHRTINKTIILCIMEPVLASVTEYSSSLEGFVKQLPLVRNTIAHVYEGSVACHIHTTHNIQWQERVIQVEVIHTYTYLLMDLMVEAWGHLVQQ